MVSFTLEFQASVCEDKKRRCFLIGSYGRSKIVRNRAFDCCWALLKNTFSLLWPHGGLLLEH